VEAQTAAAPEQDTVLITRWPGVKLVIGAAAVGRAPAKPARIAADDTNRMAHDKRMIGIGENSRGFCRKFSRGRLPRAT
jgi:hypothetical protein